MDFIQIIMLGLIQGITEFLPVSSSGHLVLVSILLGWEDQGLLMDVAAHGGSLLAVMTYFRKEIQEMFAAVLNPQAEENARTIRLILAIIVATIPIILAGLMFSDIIERYLRDAKVVALTTIIFAIFLAYADRMHRSQVNEYTMSWKAVIVIGVAQIFALIPGTSRSGVTMTAALMMGLDRVSAARFSFLISMPTILAAILYKSLQISFAENSLDWTAIIGVFSISAVVAYLCIELFVRLVNVIGMMPFVIYRIILGVALFVFI